MVNKLRNEWRSQLAFILLLLMICSLFLSRVLLSACLVGFLAVSFMHNKPVQHSRNFMSQPILWGMSMLFFIPLISGIWSDDKETWQEIMRIKIPLLAIPLAFASPFRIKHEQWIIMAWVFIICVLMATGWTMAGYLSDVPGVHRRYLEAATMITPLGNDHVRFSWVVAIAAVLAGWLAFRSWKKERNIFILSAAIAAWLIIFLHILSVRTGLVCLYIVLFMAGLHLLRKKRKWMAVIVLILVFALPLLAYQLFPTFRNRVQFMRFSFDYFKKADYLQGSNDAIRVISWKAGFDIMIDHPITGVGHGDLKSESREWYTRNYPQMMEEEKIYPANEFLVYGAGSGIAGLLIFMAIMLWPFLIRTRELVLWRSLNLAVVTAFLFDIGLEVQYGVFIYSFMVCWWWKWLTERHSANFRK